MAATIGFVEDDEVIRENYSEFMTSLGYRVRAFPDRGSALRAFRESLPDLAVLDVGLGSERDGGYRLCLDLRQSRRSGDRVHDICLRQRWISFRCENDPAGICFNLADVMAWQTGTTTQACR